MENHFKKYSHVKSDLIYGDLSRPIPEITVFVPTYKRANLLCQALDSILANKGVTFEIVIVDNNPERQDETELLIQSKYKRPEVFYYKNRENIGMTGNWNRGMELSRTPWVYMLHDDDVLLPETLQVVLKIIKRYSDAAVITGTSIKFAGEGVPSRLSNPSYYPSLNYRLKLNDFVYGNRLVPSACTFKKESIMSIGGWDESYYPSQDYEIAFRCLINNGKIICNVSNLCFYRWAVNASLKENVTIGFIKNWETIYNNYILTNLNYFRRLVNLSSNVLHYDDLKKRNYPTLCIDLFDLEPYQKNRLMNRRTAVIIYKITRFLDLCKCPTKILSTRFGKRFLHL